MRFRRKVLQEMLDWKASPESKGKAKSASYILSRPDIFGVDQCIKLGEYNVGHVDGKITLPYYMAFLLEEDGISPGPSPE